MAHRQTPNRPFQPKVTLAATTFVFTNCGISYSMALWGTPIIRKGYFTIEFERLSLLPSQRVAGPLESDHRGVVQLDRHVHRASIFLGE
jgi:hypothetical protein